MKRPTHTRPLGCAVPARGAMRRAFTILELMLAIFILGLVLTAIYATWMAILRGTKVSLEAAAAVQRSRIAMHALEDALLTAHMYTANIRHYAFLGDHENLSLVARLPASFPGVGRYGDQIVRRVSFELKQGEGGLDRLVMTQVPMLLDLESGDIEPYSIVLAKDVSVFDLLYYDLRQQDWVDEWSDTNQMPRLVQITLGLGKVPHSASQPRDVVTRIVALPSMAVPPGLQGFGGAMAPPGLNRRTTPVPVMPR
ncbi:MAG: prepilin-type N-terminal cleavage/methylation domain-containing protein [Verrucomicrobia bacterium]|nr:prepilin-type N-terminal cleavage/methylation domain-containing protein [Verrucomicrobiota bacterium]